MLGTGFLFMKLHLGGRFLFARGFGLSRLIYVTDANWNGMIIAAIFWRSFKAKR